MKWKLTANKPTWPEEVAVDSYDVPPASVSDDKIRVSYVGHVSFLIQVEGINILTDPVWSQRASPFSFIGPKRVVPAGIKLSDLPKIDLILISHNHYDHLDIPTLKQLYLKHNPVIITPLKNEIVINSHLPKAEVKTLAWGEMYKFKQLEIFLEPAQHWSARGIFDKNKALWGTFIIKTQKGNICFIGDTGYSKKIFKEIGKKFDKMFLSLIPIGAFEPRWFMKDVHVNPEEAVFIHKDLNSECSIATHYETFQLADDHFDQPAKELKAAKIKHAIPPDKFILPKAGEVFWF